MGEFGSQEFLQWASTKDWRRCIDAQESSVVYILPQKYKRQMERLGFRFTWAVIVTYMSEESPYMSDHSGFNHRKYEWSVNHWDFIFKVDILLRIFKVDILLRIFIKTFYMKIFKIIKNWLFPKFFFLETSETYLRGEHFLQKIFLSIFGRVRWIFRFFMIFLCKVLYKYIEKSWKNKDFRFWPTETLYTSRESWNYVEFRFCM